MLRYVKRVSDSRARAEPCRLQRLSHYHAGSSSRAKKRHQYVQQFSGGENGVGDPRRSKSGYCSSFRVDGRLNWSDRIARM